METYIVDEWYDILLVGDSKLHRVKITYEERVLDDGYVVKEILDYDMEGE